MDHEGVGDGTAFRVREVAMKMLFDAAKKNNWVRTGFK